jgi:hypothetical protein
MRKTLALLVALAGLAGSPALQAQQPVPSQADLQEFLARHRDAMRPLEQLFDELADEDLPLEDVRGQSLTRRNIEDRRQSVRDLTATIDALALAPQDLVLATRLFVQTETLTDDLFDLSQAAYDDDREELAKRLHDLETVIDRHRAWTESYLLSLAADRQARLVKVEQENAELKKKLAVHEQRRGARGE